MRAVFLFLLPTLVGPVLSFTPCPLLGPSYPPYTLNNNDSTLAETLKVLENNFTDLVTTYNGPAGGISPNTSFSIALFSSNEGTAGAEPSFWEFDYTSPALAKSSPGSKNVSQGSIYGIGGLTEVFTVWSLLIADGDILEDRVTKYFPELSNASINSTDPVSHVQWDEIMIGHLASHMSGLPRDYCPNDLISQGPTGAGLPEHQKPLPTCCGSDDKCRNEGFIKQLASVTPVAPAGYTPLYSNTAFQLLGYLLERRGGKPFQEILQAQILDKLGLNETTVFAPVDSSQGVIPVSKEASGWSTRKQDRTASMFSSAKDLSVVGQAILDSRLLSPAQTRRWLKPVSLTSNPANSMSTPWGIYSVTSNYNDTGFMVEIFNILSNEGNGDGLYSSYLGLVPSYGVGFAILSADTESPADLNAHADYLSSVIKGLTSIAISQAAENFGGAYANLTGDFNSSITVGVDELPGLFVNEFVSNGVDFRNTLAELLNIHNGTDRSNSKQAFRAVYQDKTAFADAGTATCISWMDVERLQYNGHGLDEFTFALNTDGKAVGVEIPALGLTLGKQK
ncbi:Beta-lactamase-like protein [Penicillium chermesinum]|uniref:Beta-lactamase-like protein n=1 Tax=Penicillium chermesinum TaxID=63820 RepID=A0A9W9PLE7_9EURO|nr:Beta-lactamase-like protein [Penicillium chermesinum]KAJ5247452.1 Beta-lactamase-like protein [Penicillium chermesinum]